MAIIGTSIRIDTTEGMDKITSTEKVTTPYFSGGGTELLGANIVTTSYANTNETYYYGISNSSTATTTEFDVTFGSLNGYGSNVETNTKAETEAIYKQFASLLLAPSEVTGGFQISTQGSAGLVTGRDEEIYVMLGRRSLMKDRLNKGVMDILFTGSNGVSAGSNISLRLTDDSKTTKPTATPAGDRYNIVSGSGGTVSGSGATYKTYGWFWPDQGIIVFSGKELSGSIPGAGLAASSSLAAQFNSIKSTGFGYPTTTNGDKNVALRLINCLKAPGGKLSFRDEEDQVSAQYFCRVRSGHMNFSNNPTFTSGNLNELRNKKMKGNPSTFITSVQLHNASGDIVAVGNLSKPLKKNFTSEATIKVKLTY
tara:strand:+ start:4623 stop:5726 length:1104 start_codon:yes stop_codon:yes gene_type:complete